MKALVIEDDPVIITIVGTVLSENNIEVEVSDDASGGEKKAKEENFDIIILDLGLPDKNGLDICKDLRESGNITPILILTANDGVDAKVEGLEKGADDYLTKPFNADELLARINAITRRYKTSGAINESVLQCGELTLNLLDRTFTVSGNKVLLTNNEFDLLSYFMQNANRVISQEELSSEVWDIHFNTRTNYINVYISYLRKKIAEYSDTDYIKTIRKKGFKFICT